MKILINLTLPNSWCLKINEKVSFNIASEASYIYKNWLKMPKMLNLASFWKPKACGQTELPDRSVLIGQKLVENAKIGKCAIMGDFQTLWLT